MGKNTFYTPFAVGLISFICLAGCTSRSPAGNATSTTNQNVKPTVPLTVSAGQDQIVSEQNTISLNSTVEGQEGLPVSYAWSQVGGDHIATPAGSTASSNVLFLAPTVLNSSTITFKVVASDTAGRTAEDTILVTVNPVNAPPTISISELHEVTEAEAVTLNAMIADPDGLVERIQWRQIDGLAVPLENADSATLSFQPPDISERTRLSFLIEAEDNERGISQKTVNVYVNPVFIPPTVETENEITAESHQKLTLTATAQDSDGTIESIAWEQVGGPTVELRRNQDSAIEFYVPFVSTERAVTFRVTAKDNDGNTSSQSVVVNATPPISVPIFGTVSFNHEISVAQVSAEKILPNGDILTDGPSMRSTTKEGDIYSLVLPGNGLYKLYADITLQLVDTEEKAIIAFESSSLANERTTGKVRLSAIARVAGESANANINLLTHFVTVNLTDRSPLEYLDPESTLVKETEANVHQLLSAYVPNPPSTDFSAYSVYDSPYSKASPSLLLFGEILMAYAKNINSKKQIYFELQPTLDVLSSAIADPSLIETFTPGIQDVVKHTSSRINETRVLDTLRRRVGAKINITPANLAEVFDFDGDGQVNLLDEDDDNDGMPDHEDPVTSLPMIKPNTCQSGHATNVSAVGNNATFNIINRARPDHVLQAPSGNVSAQPLMQPNQLGAMWVLETANPEDNSFRLKLKDSTTYLTLDQDAASGLKLEIPQADNDNQVWIFREVSVSSKVNPVYLLESKAAPNFRIATDTQSSYTIDSLYNVIARESTLVGAGSEQWAFCWVDKNLPSTGAPDTAFQSACHLNTPTLPSVSTPTVFQIQSAWRQAQFINRSNGLKVSPILDSRSKANNWQVIPIPNTDKFFIRSVLDNTFFSLGGAGLNSLHLSLAPYPNGLSEWRFKRVHPTSTQHFITSVADASRYLLADEASVGELHSVHNLNIGVSTEDFLSARWWFCEI